MASQGGGVGQDYVVAYHAVVRHMRISHDQRVVPNASQASALHRSAIHGDEFADRVVIADLKPCGLCLVADVLGSQSDRRKWKKTIVGADTGWTLHRYVRDQFAALPKLAFRSYVPKRPN